MTLHPEDKRKLSLGLLIFAIPFILFFGFMGAVFDGYIFHHPAVVIYSIPFIFVTLAVAIFLAFRPKTFGLEEDDPEK
ncbi:MAG: hypothetical protein QW767_04135 [Thermoprotei archaeon]